MPRPAPIYDPVRSGLAFADATPSAIRHALREQLGGADPSGWIAETLEDLTDALIRDAAYAADGLTPDRAASLPFIANHLRNVEHTRATNPAYHAHRLTQAERYLAWIADADTFAAERRQAGDDPTEATLRVLRFVRAAWSEVPGGMDGAPEAAPTLAEFVAAHVAHAQRLRARQSDAGREPGPTPPPMIAGPGTGDTPSGKRATKPTREPSEPTPTLPLAFAARELFRLTPAALRGMVKRGEVAAKRFGSERWTFDRGDVERWNPAAIGRIDAIIAARRKPGR